MTDEECETIVIDNGSGTLKAGIAGNEQPDIVLPSIVGHVRRSVGYTNNIYVGDMALDRSGILILEHPNERYTVTNWDNLEKIWTYAFENLGHDSSERNILLTDSSLSPKINREKMAQIMFETFNVKSFYVCSQELLSIYASGRTTGIVYNVGYSTSQMVPIYESEIISDAVIRHNVAGKDLTLWLQKMLYDLDGVFISKQEHKAVSDLKEKHSYVAYDYHAELDKVRFSSEYNKSCIHPDGRMITLSDELFRCPELLFRPHLNGFEFDGVDKCIYDSIMKCDIGYRKELFNNIVLSGGTTMIEGLPERITKEISNFAPYMNVKIIAPPERKYMAWIGGSIYASLSNFSQKLITLKEFKENGSRIVQCKCP